MAEELFTAERDDGFEPDPANDGVGTQRVAIIWLPGLKATGNTALDAIARRIACALDRRSVTSAAKFSVAPTLKEIDRGKAGKVRRASIVRLDGSEQVPVVDVFEIDYREVLLRPHLDGTALIRWIEATWVVIRSLVLTLSSLFHARGKHARGKHARGKTVKERSQLFVGAIYLAFLIMYVWILFISVIIAISTLLGLEWLPVVGCWEEASKILGVLLVLAFGASATVPAMRARVEEAGARTISAFAYLHAGRQQSVLAGRVADLVEHLAEERAIYRRVDIFAYSFGSLVAIDTLFPYARSPEPRLGIVKWLVTIGCPFDAVRTIWPSYAEGRGALQGSPAGWLNIYSPLDVFGSHFRDGNEPGAPTVSIAASGDAEGRKPENFLFQTSHADSLGLVDVILLGGFRAHTYYWADQEEGENTCFNDIVSELYINDWILR
jgi:hypothetical protein